ncbi:MAG TPA: bifunctional diaminohydroxyphosphoribosylaminopyrimidine deaminase/5-amino-6-(5-phosphoribosylamino)uracil reductase RibD [Candidatus Eremiobacteraceae bacterium]
MDEALHMRRALELAAKARGNTSPNPMVGAVILGADGHPAGEGYHDQAGSRHAEVMALEHAGEKARGGTLYITLEPCDHEGRTPPCTQAIVSAGILRVVVAAEDADSRVRGRGIAKLRAAGVQVDVGLGRAEAAELNVAYTHHRTTGRSFVSLKMAASLDGAVAPRAGVRHRLTGTKAFEFVNELRYTHDAVLVGVHTAIVDDPRLTVRPPRPRAVPYLRIVTDDRGHLPLDGHLVRDAATTPTLVVTTAAMPADRREALTEHGVEFLVCHATAEGYVDLGAMLTALGERGIISILCEGGPTIAAAMLAGAHVGRVYWLVAPEILGSATLAPAIATATRTPTRTGLRIDSIAMLGLDLLVTATPTKTAPIHADGSN